MAKGTQRAFAVARDGRSEALGFPSGMPRKGVVKKLNSIIQGQCLPSNLGPLICKASENKGNLGL